MSDGICVSSTLLTFISNTCFCWISLVHFSSLSPPWMIHTSVFFFFPSATHPQCGVENWICPNSHTCAHSGTQANLMLESFHTAMVTGITHTLTLSCACKTKTAKPICVAFFPPLTLTSTSTPTAGEVNFSALRPTWDASSRSRKYWGVIPWTHQIFSLFLCLVK